MCKGIILAGGSGSRLFPITKGVSKQLLPIYDKPMIYYPLSVLMIAGIRDILIITTPEDNESFKRLLGNGREFGVHLEYAIQEKPNGLAEAFIIGEKFIGNDSVCLILGDNIFHGPGFSELLKNAVFNADNDLATIFGYYVNDPERYGVVEFETQGDINVVKSIEEKPQTPKSNYAVVGLYFYPNKVVEIAKNIKPSARGELEITEVNNQFLNYKYNIYKYPSIAYATTAGPLNEETYGKPEITERTENDLVLEILPRGFAWLDTGTFESLAEASNYVKTIENRQGLKIACLEEIGYRNAWITKKNLLHSAESMAKNEYGEYLKKLYNENNLES